MRFTFTTDPEELEKAVSYARRSIEADPRLAEPRIWLGYALLRQAKPLEAYEEERQVMKLDPSLAFGAYFAACALLVAGRREEALSLYQKAVETDPQLGFAWLGLGWTHLELGHRAEARWSIGKAVQLEREKAPGSTAGAAGYLGECLRRSGELAEARARCLEGLEVVERSDHMYRDTFRALCLCSLGRTALEQGDLAAARVAFGQAASHLRGRPRTLGGGHLLVQALAGLSRAGEGPAPFQQALTLFERREGFDFGWLWGCADDVTLLELARAARALGRVEEPPTLLERARQAGSTEALAEMKS
jgi:tetratricopeptide (TPR) repeat protein